MQTALDRETNSNQTMNSVPKMFWTAEKIHIVCNHNMLKRLRNVWKIRSSETVYYVRISKKYYKNVVQTQSKTDVSAVL